MQNYLSEIEFIEISDDKTLVYFLYKDEIYMTAIIENTNSGYKIFYPSVVFPEACKADILHLEYKRGRQSAKKITPYLYYFRTRKVQEKIERELIKHYKKN